MATVDESWIQLLSSVHDDCSNKSHVHDQVVNENADLVCHEMCKNQSCSSLYEQPCLMIHICSSNAPLSLLLPAVRSLSLPAWLLSFADKYPGSWAVSYFTHSQYWQYLPSLCMHTLTHRVHLSYLKVNA